jgi:glycerol uptake facilitator-like aquaporin
MIKKVATEFIGTFLFLYVILATGHFLAIGAALALVVYLGGPISGGNFNPAVTLMMVVAKKQKMDTLVPYILAQIAGGMLALLLFRFTF